MADIVQNKAAPPQKRLEADLRRLQSLRTEAAHTFVENVNNPFHQASRAFNFADSNFELQQYWQNLSSIQDALERANLQLTSGDSLRAGKFLDLAENWIAESEHGWMAYHGELQTGAKRGIYTSAAVAGTAAGVLTGGAALGAGGAVAGGASVGAHFIGGAVWLGGEEEENKPATMVNTEADTDQGLELPITIDEVTLEPKPFPQNAKQPDLSESADIEGNDLSEEEKQAELELEREIRREIRAVPKKYSLPKKEQLIAWAKEHLTRYQQNHDIPLDPQLGKFFLQSEMNNPEDGELVANWQKMISEYKPTNGNASVEDLVKNYLFGKYLQNYSRENAHLADFMKGFGGNCEAETKMIVAGVAASGARLPEGFQLGVQSFTDHIQAVGYNKDTGEVMELLTGTIVPEVKAPIYHPYYLLDGYLRGQQASLSVSLDELLIVDSASDETGEGTTTNSVAQYRGGRGRFSSGSIPEYTALSYGQTLAETLSSHAYQDGAFAQTSGLQKFERATTVSEISDDDWESSFGTQTKESAFRGSPFINHYFRGILFKDPKHTAEYNALSSAVEKQQYLIALTAKTMQDREPEYRRFLDILQNPTLFTKLPEADIAAAIDAFHDIDNLQEDLVRTLSEMTAQNGQYQLAHERAKIAIETKLATLFPISLKRKSVLENFAERVFTKPHIFILFANTLSAEKRKLFVALLENGGLGNNFGNSRKERFNNNLYQFLSDKHLVGFGKKAGFAAEQKTSQPANGVPLEIELIEISQLPRNVQQELAQAKAKLGVQDRKAVPGHKVSKGTLQVDQQSKYTIKPETMIEFILYFNANLAKRWTP